MKQDSRSRIRYLTAGDKAVVMEFGDEISKEINERIRNVVGLIDDAGIDGIQEILPTYRSILIMYDPLKINYGKLTNILDDFGERRVTSGKGRIKIVEIPTLYGGEYGPDIDFVAEHNGITVDEVVKIHSGTDYLVYMLGFTPGFTYLGGMSERIAAPRLPSPRAVIPAGSVGIGGSQTGMYPSETPGGWRLIGRTPLRLYDLRKEPPVLVNAGDYVRYVPIGESEYNCIKQMVEDGKYEVRTVYSDGDEPSRQIPL